MLPQNSSRRVPPKNRPAGSALPSKYKFNKERRIHMNNNVKKTFPENYLPSNRFCELFGSTSKTVQITWASRETPSHSMIFIERPALTAN